MSDADSCKFVPLNHFHKSLGARMVNFGGWSMPVQYQGIIQEHNAVRQAAGLFDISHMGEILVGGSGAEAFLNSVLTNDVSVLSDTMGQYTLLLNHQGGVIDDLLIYRLSPTLYYLVVNATKIEEVEAWLREQAKGDITILNESSVTCGLALQGPASPTIFSLVFGADVQPPLRNQILLMEWNKSMVRVARTGYTGEDGFEFFMPNELAETLATALLDQGKSLGCIPCGLGARDSLRLEACLPLNGHELSPAITPLEAGLSKFVKLSKPGGFIGSEALKTLQTKGLQRTSVAFTMVGTTPPPREGYAVLKEGHTIGHVTSGVASPTLKKGIGMALINLPKLEHGNSIEIEIRGKSYSALAEKKPLYKRQ